MLGKIFQKDKKACGHKPFQVPIKGTAKVYAILGIKKRGKEEFSKNHKFEYEVLTGERVGTQWKTSFYSPNNR